MTRALPRFLALVATTASLAFQPTAVSAQGDDVILVRGATVQLNGHYVLKGGALDFRGTVRLDARASQTMTGWKSWVTKVFDPILAKDGAGTVLPIKVTGTAKQPKFGVEVKKIF